MTRHRLLLCALPLIAGLAGCKTTDTGDWVRSGFDTPFDQASDSCFEQANANVEKGKQTAFFVGCMGALGWKPKIKDITIEGLDD